MFHALFLNLLNLAVVTDSLSEIREVGSGEIREEGGSDEIREESKDEIGKEGSSSSGSDVDEIRDSKGKGKGKGLPKSSLHGKSKSLSGKRHYCSCSFDSSFDSSLCYTSTSTIGGTFSSASEGLRSSLSLSGGTRSAAGYVFYHLFLFLFIFQVVRLLSFPWSLGLGPRDGRAHNSTRGRVFGGFQTPPDFSRG